MPARFFQKKSGWARPVVIWLWRKPWTQGTCLCSRQRLLPDFFDGKHCSSMQEQCREEAGLTPCHHHAGFKTGTKRRAVTGQPQVWTVTFWGDVKHLSVRGTAVPSSTLRCKNAQGIGGNPLCHQVLQVSPRAEGFRSALAPHVSCQLFLSTSAHRRWQKC